MQSPTTSASVRARRHEAGSGKRQPAMAGQPQAQPFRFWLPYRSNVGSSRQQPPAVPTSPRPQPALPTTKTTAERPPRASPSREVEGDVPMQAESSHESGTIPVQSLDSPRRRGTRRAMADLELTLPRSPRAGQEQSTRGGGDDGGNDTKISISGFPRSRLFDGARAPYRREIEDGLKSLAARGAPVPRTESGLGYRVITLAGHNVGASMIVGGGSNEHAPSPRATDREGSARPPAVAANVNSNVQSVNNSSMEASTCNDGDPGVRLDIKNAHEQPVEVPPPKKEQEEKPKEPVRRPPLVVAPPENREATRPPRARRCLRALVMESGSDTESARKPRPGACRFQCVADHAPPATTSNGGGDAKSGEGGKETTQN
ncbi:hypothetical protein GUJ93_ZPchr0009g2197 [Zizania palustris]|uniref:Uncharacterized protein n=1 Tax=Zizania palustris TaxID=103762 RepID=A0A8J5VLZ9_ZIZPA|nr:hypothetical protein GUJ93_ZPchr0009g2197 [Zizania palustris]